MCHEASQDESDDVQFWESLLEILRVFSYQHVLEYHIDLCVGPMLH